jgi:arylsulfatase
MHSRKWSLLTSVVIAGIVGYAAAVHHQALLEGDLALTATAAQKPKGTLKKAPAKKTPAKNPKAAAQAPVSTYTGPQFRGFIARSSNLSLPSWPEPVRAKPGTPNVVFIVLDDVGFGQLACFGGLINTPNIDKLAVTGLRYTNFHTTGLSAPSRAVILSGRNHHACGMGVMTELATGFPGYNGIIPFENGLLSEILSAAGYATFAVGKWHLTPETETNLAAAKTRWPLGRGFERFYGFLGGDTHQYFPDLVYDNHPVDPPRTPKQGYHFSEDMTAKAIHFIRDLRHVTPDKPFFLYYCPAAMHAPQHVPPEWIARYKGKFDIGWDRARDMILDRQKKLGVMPGNTVLPLRSTEVQAWAAVYSKQQKLCASMMEVFAGMLEHTDHQIGRLLDYLGESGQLDDTLIVLTSANGASAEGGANGRFNEGSLVNGIAEDADYLWTNRQRLGLPHTYNQYPSGWSMAGNTPFKRWKGELHLGGIRDPLVVHWPRRIKSQAALRHQYAHATDLVPTVLDALGLEPPTVLKGYPQNPIHGVSFAHTFDDAAAPSKHTTQYYEMFGSRAIYQGGWTAVAPHLPLGTPIDEKELINAKWELYHTDVDASQAYDLGSRNPEKVREMDQRWWAEAAKYNVLPLDGRVRQRRLEPRPQVTAPRNLYMYYPDAAPVPSGVAAPTLNRSYRITADVAIPAGGAEGVLLAHGGAFGGWSFYLQEGKLRFTYNWQGREYYDLVANVPPPAGKALLAYQFDKTGSENYGAGGTGRLFINGKAAAELAIPKTNPVSYWPHNEGLTCGYDNLTPVALSYESPFAFTGTIRKVVVEVK